jgi:two-component system, NarL family, response regulator NreC
VQANGQRTATDGLAASVVASGPPGSEVVTLRDGSSVTVRAVGPGDEAPLLKFLTDLCADSRRLRYFSGCVDVAGAAHWAAGTPADRDGLLAHDEMGVLVAHAACVQLDQTRAEVAIEVADHLHDRGLGTILLERLAAVAEERGVTRFVAEVLPENRLMLDVFRDGFDARVALHGGIEMVEFPTSSWRLARERFDGQASPGDVPTHLHLASSAVATVPVGSVTPATLQVTVVLADDHELMRRSLRLLLDGEEGVEVIAEASNLDSVMHRVQSERPQVLVLDLGLPDGSSIEAIGQLRERAPETQIVALTMEDSPVFAQRALAAGALGFVAKELADDELPEAVRAAARGEEYISPRMAPRLDAIGRSLTEEVLSAREVNILRLTVHGHTSVEIARKLRISPRTVETHRAHIFTKLKLGTRAELVHYALGRGLLRA